MQIQIASPEDLEFIEDAYTHARAFMQANGALHNWGCSWGLNPPVSRSARVM